MLCPAVTRAAVRERCRRAVINGYGPTESTTFSCCFDATSAGRSTVGADRPADRQHPAYVLDREREPTPVGVPGEL